MTPQLMTFREELRAFVVDNFLFGQEDAAPGDDDSLLERGIIDSTGVLELTQFLERRLEITIADEELIPENLDSIRNIEVFIRRRTGME